MAEHQASNQSSIAPPSLLPAIDILVCCHGQVRCKLCRYRFLIAISTETEAGFSNACKNESIASLQIDVHKYHDHKYKIFIYKNLQVYILRKNGRNLYMHVQDHKERAVIIMLIHANIGEHGKLFQIAAYSLTQRKKLMKCMV